MMYKNHHTPYKMALGPIAAKAIQQVQNRHPYRRTVNLDGKL